MFLLSVLFSIIDNMKSSGASSTRKAVPLLILLFLSFLCSFAVDAEDAFPRLEPNRDAYAFAAAGTADWRDALRLGLWASADPPAGGPMKGDAEPFVRAIASAVSELSAATAGMDDRTKGEAVISYMHRRFLSGYSERQTRLDFLLSTGKFNCVSSAVLYYILARSVGLEVSGVVTSDHAFCSVRVGVENVDVETTSPYGFDPGGKKEFHDSFGRVTGYAYVPQRNYRDRSPIGGTELFSLILSNRIADLDAAGMYAESVGLGVDRWALLGGSGAVGGKVRDELVVRLTNYGAALVRSRQEDRALAWAEASRSAYGDDPRWTDFISAAANNLIVLLLRDGRSGEARIELARLKPSLDPKSFRDLDSLVRDADLVSLAESGDAASLSSSLAEARQAGTVSEKRLREIEVYARLKILESIARSDGWAAAYREAQRAAADLGSDPSLANALRVYRANRIAELHNAFAAFYNAGSYAEARAKAMEALAEFPDESRFRTLADTAQRALAQTSR